MNKTNPELQTFISKLIEGSYKGGLTHAHTHSHTEGEDGHEGSMLISVVGCVRALVHAILCLGHYLRPYL